MWLSLKERCGLHFLADELPASPDDSDNSVSESLDEFDYSVAEISRSFRSQQEICEQLNINHMIDPTVRAPVTTSFHVPPSRGTPGFPSVTKKQLTARWAGTASPSLLRAPGVLLLCTQAGLLGRFLDGDVGGWRFSPG